MSRDLQETDLELDLVDWTITDGEPDKNLTEEEKQPWEVKVKATGYGVTIDFMRGDQVVNAFFEINHGHPAVYVDYGGDNLVQAFMRPDGVYVENGDGVQDHEVVKNYAPPFEQREHVKEIRRGYFFPEKEAA